MGAVFEGVRTSDGKRVAVKVLADALATNPVSRARFLGEARLTSRVRHPNIVEVIDAGEDGGQAFIVMELLEGEDLARRLRSGPLSAAEAVDVLAPVCDAVATAHQAGVTHRDLKPSNIFLAVKDGRVSPTVLDFGIAQGDDGGGDPLVPAGQATPVVFGSPMYLAPELVADHRAAGPASDQYALGVILYESLTGEQPYIAADVQQLLRAIATGKPPSPRERRPEIPPKLEAAVLRAMSGDPQARFATVAELRAALAPFGSAPSQEARPPRRRAPSSPAIEVEAAVPSPFVRTLVPEAQAQSGPWFVAPAAPDDIWDQPVAALAPASPAKPVVFAHGDLGGDTNVVLTPRAGADLARAAGALSRAFSRPRNLAIGAAVALGAAGLVLLVRGGSSPAPARPAPAVASAPAPEPPRAAAPVAPPPPVAVAPPAAAAAPAPPPPPVAVTPPAAAAEPAPPPPPVAVAPPPPAAEPPPPRAAEPPPPPVAERPVPPARHERPAPPAPEAPAAERAPTPRARSRAGSPGSKSTEIRMHNGVPLLD